MSSYWISHATYEQARAHADQLKRDGAVGASVMINVDGYDVFWTIRWLNIDQ